MFRIIVRGIDCDRALVPFGFLGANWSMRIVDTSFATRTRVRTRTITCEIAYRGSIKISISMSRNSKENNPLILLEVKTRNYTGVSSVDT